MGRSFLTNPQISLGCKGDCALPSLHVGSLFIIKYWKLQRPFLYFCIWTCITLCMIPVWICESGAEISVLQVMKRQRVKRSLSFRQHFSPGIYVAERRRCLKKVKIRGEKNLLCTVNITDCIKDQNTIDCSTNLQDVHWYLGWNSTARAAQHLLKLLCTSSSKKKKRASVQVHVFCEYLIHHQRQPLAKRSAELQH